MVLQYKGTQIFYTDEGQGDVVVLLHGFLETSSMWRNLVPHLHKNYRVICIDLLGHGQTGSIGYIHTMELMSSAVETVLEHLDIESSLMIGHSMGGYVALAYAEKHAAKLEGLCLMNSTYVADNNERKALRARANKMVQTNFKNMVRMSFTNLFSEKSRDIYKAEIQLALTEALQTPLQGYLAAQEGMRIRKNQSMVFKGLKCKKMIVVGKKDTVVNGQKLIEEAKESNSEIVKLSEGHMSHIENIEEFTYKILHFIEKL